MGPSMGAGPQSLVMAKLVGAWFAMFASRRGNRACAYPSWGWAMSAS